MATIDDPAGWLINESVISVFNDRVGGLLLIQFTAAQIVAAGHRRTNDALLPLPPIRAAVAVPVFGFFAARTCSRGLRAAAPAQELRASTRLQ